MKESKIRRSEVLLYDQSDYMRDIRMTVEEMLAIIYLEFMQQIKKEGNNEKVMKAILKGIGLYNR
ncbi:hypothetical protein CUU64_18770 [Bacillus sp. V5-8f]|nr:hypothetical protein CUU64_18770 [Bacillus sp. V5-8f]